jgi:type VI secretion system protein ImpJ
VKFLSPVVWHEGMPLAQHHFQAQSRYFEDLTRFVLSCGDTEAWGMLDLELDAEALLNGTAVLVQGRGLLPDGTPFQFPHDEPPAPLAVLPLFSPTSDSHVLLLGLPEFQADRGNCAAPAAGARYSPVSAQVLDDTSGTQERPVEFAHRNFRLLLDIEPAAGMVTLPIARIRRDGKGHFVFDPAYVAPALRIGASPRLMSLLSRLV